VRAGIGRKRDSAGGTAIAAAIKTALTAFKENNHYKVLVLFTDGEDNDTGALEAAQDAAKAGLKIFTIGIGTEKGELVRVADANAMRIMSAMNRAMS